MRAASARQAHTARLMARQTFRKTIRPTGNYVQTGRQWGQVTATHEDEPTPTVDVNLDGSEQTTYGIPIKVGYIPTVGDVVSVARGLYKGRTSRYVHGKLRGAASPYPTPLGGFDSTGRFTDRAGVLWGSADTPDPALGAAGHWCMSQSGHLFWNSPTVGWTMVI